MCGILATNIHEAWWKERHLVATSLNRSYGLMFDRIVMTNNSTIRVAFTLHIKRCTQTYTSSHTASAAMVIRSRWPLSDELVKRVLSASRDYRYRCSSIASTPNASARRRCPESTPSKMLTNRPSSTGSWPRLMVFYQEKQSPLITKGCPPHEHSIITVGSGTECWNTRHCQV